MKGATHWMRIHQLNRLNFNPRTREGCDGADGKDISETLAISIHAPVKGATTSRPPLKNDVVDISIHAPVKGATLKCLDRKENMVISIHAPVKGATLPM